jgi:hypothetical protein
MIDENSFSFRYPTTRDKRAVLFGKDPLDLDLLHDVMAGLYGYFTGNDRYLTDLQEAYAQSI